MKLLNFAAAYSLMKCIKTMLMGLVVMGVILAVRQCTKNTGRTQYLMLLLPAAAFTGMSKLFFLRGTVYITAFLHGNIQPIHGKCYFAVCAVLLFRMCLLQRGLQRSVRSLPVWWDQKERRSAIDAVTEGDYLPFCRRYLQTVRIYVSREEISPFSGGIFRPYVVMPQAVLEEWSPEQRRLVLCHELLHIRQGHILWLTLFQLLKIYWWANPAIYFYIRLLREDMELACDERCVAYTGAAPALYAGVMLRMLQMVQRAEPAGSPAFLKRDDFDGMRRRMERLAQMSRPGQPRRRYRLQAVCFGLGVLLTIGAVAATSYPRYTRMTELVLYDDRMHMVDYDSEELRRAARVEDGRLVVDEGLFAQLLADRAVEGEYVYLSYDTIMKVPGCGGGGNVGMISMSDCGDIFYLAADCTENRVMEFCL